MQVAKMSDGRIVQIVKISETVQFSPDKWWVLICIDFERAMSKRQDVKWIPISTRFDWVKEFVEV